LFWQFPLEIWSTQAPAEQYLPDPHGATLLDVQAPAPLQTDAVCTAKSVLHNAVLQVISLPG
jgi:hypothetical protein